MGFFERFNPFRKKEQPTPTPDQEQKPLSEDLRNEVSEAVLDWTKVTESFDRLAGTNEELSRKVNELEGKFGELDTHLQGKDAEQLAKKLKEVKRELKDIESKIRKAEKASGLKPETPKSPATSEPDVEVAKERQIVDLPPKVLLELIGGEELKGIILDLANPNMAKEGKERLREVFSVSGPKKEALAKKLALFGYRVDDFVTEWSAERDGRYSVTLELLNSWVAETSDKLADKAIGFLERAKLSVVDRAKLSVATLLPTLGVVLGTGTALASGGVGKIATGAVVGALGGFAAGLLKHCSKLKEGMAEMGKKAEEKIATKKREKIDEKKQTAEVKKNIKDYFANNPDADLQIAAFLSVGLAEATLAGPDPNATAEKPDKHRGSYANERVLHARVMREINSEKEQTVVGTRADAEFLAGSREAKLDELLAELYAQKDEDVITEMLRKDPTLIKVLKKIQAFKELNLEELFLKVKSEKKPGKTAEAPTGPEPVNDKEETAKKSKIKEVAQILLSTLAGAGVGAAGAAFGEVRNVALGLAGGYLSAKFGQYRDEKSRMEAFKKQVEDQLARAEKILVATGEGSKNLDKLKGNTALLRNIAGDLRLPLRLGLLKTNVNLEVRVTSLLRQIEGIEFESTKAETGNSRVDKLLEALEKDVEELKGRTTATEERMTKKGIISHLRVGGYAVAGFAAGFFGRDIVGGLLKDHHASGGGHTGTDSGAEVKAILNANDPTQVTETDFVNSPDHVDKILSHVDTGRGGSPWGKFHEFFMAHKSEMKGISFNKWFEEQMAGDGITVKGPNGETIDKVYYKFDHAHHTIQHPLTVHPKAQWEFYKGGDGKIHAQIIDPDGKSVTIHDKPLVEHTNVHAKVVAHTAPEAKVDWDKDLMEKPATNPNSGVRWEGTEERHGYQPGTLAPGAEAYDLVRGNIIDNDGVHRTLTVVLGEDGSRIGFLKNGVIKPGIPEGGWPQGTPGKILHQGPEVDTGVVSKVADEKVVAGVHSPEVPTTTTRLSGHTHRFTGGGGGGGGRSLENVANQAKAGTSGGGKALESATVGGGAGAEYGVDQTKSATGQLLDHGKKPAGGARVLEHTAKHAKNNATTSESGFLHKAAQDFKEGLGKPGFLHKAAQDFKEGLGKPGFLHKAGKDFVDSLPKAKAGGHGGSSVEHVAHRGTGGHHLAEKLADVRKAGYKLVGGLHKPSGGLDVMKIPFAGDRSLTVSMSFLTEMVEKDPHFNLDFSRYAGAMAGTKNGLEAFQHALNGDEHYSLLYNPKATEVADKFRVLYNGKIVH